MKTPSHVPAPLREAARDQAVVRLTLVDSDHLPDLKARILDSDPSDQHPRSLQWLLPRSRRPVLLQLGWLLEARFTSRDRIYSFDTLVLDLVRSPSGVTLWTTLPEKLEALRRRRRRRVFPARPIRLTICLASDNDPLSALASVGRRLHHRGLLRNISEDGLNAVFPPDLLPHLRVGRNVAVSLRLPDDVEESIVDASIVYLRRRDKNKTISLGLEFHIPPAASHVRDRIADFVLRERKNHAAPDSILRFW